MFVHYLKFDPGFVVQAVLAPFVGRRGDPLRLPVLPDQDHLEVPAASSRWGRSLSSASCWSNLVLVFGINLGIRTVGGGFNIALVVSLVAIKPGRGQPADGLRLRRAGHPQPSACLGVVACRLRDHVGHHVLYTELLRLDVLLQELAPHHHHVKPRPGRPGGASCCDGCGCFPSLGAEGDGVRRPGGAGCAGRIGHAWPAEPGTH